jgi:methylated-DNA-[protein]-cysteine S-methyltransferase
MIRLTTRFESPLGVIVLASDGAALTGLYFQGQKHLPASAGTWIEDASLPLFGEARNQVLAYFAGARRTFDLPLAPAGTDFQRAVWRQLEAIPFGATRPYGELARRLGRPEAARAVGAAVGRNPISIVIPCHRAVGRDGSLTGYAGGLDRKRALLEREGAYPG